MALETAIRNAIAATPGLSALVGARVSPTGALAQGSPMPAVTYTLTGRENFNTLNSGPGSLRRVAFEVIVWSDDYDQVFAVCDLIRDRLDDLTYVGDGVKMDVLFDDEAEAKEAAEEGEEAPAAWMRSMNFRALYRATT